MSMTQHQFATLIHIEVVHCNVHVALMSLHYFAPLKQPNLCAHTLPISWVTSH